LSGYAGKGIGGVFSACTGMREALALEGKIICTNYWTQTETCEALRIYTDMNFDGLKDTIIKMLAGEWVKIDCGAFRNDMTTCKSRDDVLTLLVYLAYDRESGKTFIPNAEIRAELVRAVKSFRTVLRHLCLTGKNGKGYNKINCRYGRERPLDLRYRRCGMTSSLTYLNDCRHE